MNPQLNIDGRSEGQKVEEAVALLMSKGYVVQPPIKGFSSVTTPSGLVKFFYHRMAYYSTEMAMMYVPDKKKELVLAKKFIDSRKDSGVGKSRAITECCELIEFLFKYESYLGLNFKVTSMSVLGQDKMAWFTEKLISAYNGFNLSIEASRESLWLENLYNEQELNISEEQIKAANIRLGLEEDND